MTGIPLTHLAAQEHINDLLRKAEHSRRAAEVRPSRRFTLWSPRRFARRVLPPASVRSVHGTAFDLATLAHASGPSRDDRERR